MVPGHHCRVAKHPKISEIIQIIVLLFELYILKHIIFILKPIICCFSKNPSPSYYTLLYGYYTHYTYYFIYSSITNSSCLLFLSTVLSDEDTGPPNQDDEQDPPAGMQTPPTPPPPSSPIPGRVRAIAQLRTRARWVSIPFSLCCQINLPGFCLSFILFGLKASTSHHCQPTAVTSMCTALLKMIR